MQINIIEYLEKGPGNLYDGNKSAIIDGDRNLSFNRLKEVSTALAGIIISKADIINSPIACFLPKSMENVVADLGIIYSGNAYMNLDTRLPKIRLMNILDHIRPPLFITSHALTDTVLSLGVDISRIIPVEDAFKAGSGDGQDWLSARLSKIIDTDPLCIINTSGSTGTPKGVVLNHRGFIDFTDWSIETLKLDGTEIIGSLSPFHFDIYSFELCFSIACGVPIVIIPDSLNAFPAQIIGYLVEHRISFIFWVPTIMVNIANMDILSKYDVQCLKKIWFAGEVFPTKHLNYWRRHIPGAMFVNLYGPIEITLDCTYYIVERAFRDDEPIPIGRPCRNTDIMLLTESNEPASLSEPGELCVRGSSLAMGYYNDPEKTAQVFVQNPLNKNYPELIYRTGDWAYRNEHGELMFSGRKDTLIKHLGYRIELGEIENAVMGIQGIDNACVMYHQERKEITLFYQSEQKVTNAAIRTELLKVFPKYMLPVTFHLLAELPMNLNGKIDRNLLKTGYLTSEIV